MPAGREHEEPPELLAQGAPLAAAAAPQETVAITGGANGVPAALRALSLAGGERGRAALMRSLQRGSGNQAVLGIMREVQSGGGEHPPVDNTSVDSGEIFSLEESFVPEEHTEIRTQSEVPVVGPDDERSAGDVSGGASPAAAPGAGFVDAGRTGTRRYGDREDGPRRAARAFVSGGQTGTVPWGGGTGAGARANEGVGSIQSQVAPIYDAAANATPPRFDGWVRDATGTITVSRSYVGIASGNQGNGWWVTPAAAARINAHEVLHVNSTSALYAAHLVPLEARIAVRRRGLSGVNIGTNAADAQARVQTAVNWAATITAFQTADIAANDRMATVDTADRNSGTYPVDAGPGTVAGTAFTNRLRIPSEPNPLP
jgi:hypothetical protein